MKEQRSKRSSAMMADCHHHRKVYIVWRNARKVGSLLIEPWEEGCWFGKYLQDALPEDQPSSRLFTIRKFFRSAEEALCGMKRELEAIGLQLEKWTPVNERSEHNRG